MCVPLRNFGNFFWNIQKETEIWLVKDIYECFYDWQIFEERYESFVGDRDCKLSTKLKYPWDSSQKVPNFSIKLPLAYRQFFRHLLSRLIHTNMFYFFLGHPKHGSWSSFPSLEVLVAYLQCTLPDFPGETTSFFRVCWFDKRKFSLAGITSPELFLML